MKKNKGEERKYIREEKEKDIQMGTDIKITR